MKLLTGLSVESTISDTVVGVYPSFSQFIDNKFYREVIKNDKNNPDYVRYHVKVQAIKADWLLRDEGWEFLHALYYEGEDETFRSKTLNVIIEYLYRSIRPEIYKK